MSNFRLAEMDMTDSTFNIDLVSDAQPSDEIKCETDFEMQLKMSGAKTVFVFDQWSEAESSQVIEEAGMGSFTLPNVTFTATLLPYVHNEKFRVKISERDL